jgi:hypothetical protein
MLLPSLSLSGEAANSNYSSAVPTMSWLVAPVVVL